jgi:hypothetical protein
LHIVVRGVDGVSTCSNHSERINRTCNEATKNIRNITECLSQIISVIRNKLNTTLESPNRQAKKQLQFLKELAKLQNIHQAQTCTNANCDWGFLYSRRYGIQNFPCKHTAVDSEVIYPVSPTFTSSIANSEINVEEITNNTWEFSQNNIHNNVQMNDRDESNNFDDLLDENKECSQFLNELTKEIIFLSELPETELYKLSLDIAVDFGEFITHKSGNNRETSLSMRQDPAIRSKFRVQKWRAFQN